MTPSNLSHNPVAVVRIRTVAIDIACAQQFIPKTDPSPVPVKTAIASPGRALGGQRWRRRFRESSNHADEIAASSERQAATPQNLTFQSFA